MHRVPRRPPEAVPAVVVILARAEREVPGLLEQRRERSPGPVGALGAGDARVVALRRVNSARGRLSHFREQAAVAVVVIPALTARGGSARGAALGVAAGRGGSSELPASMSSPAPFHGSALELFLIVSLACSLPEVIDEVPYFG